MVSVPLSAALVLPPREQLRHLRILRALVALDGLEGVRVAHDERDAAALALRAAAAALDAAARDARVGTEAVLLVAVGVVDVVLGHENAGVADELASGAEMS